MADKLTKFISLETIVTDEFNNSFYGGLHGTTQGDALSATDPRVAGHNHDGQHLDGHAQKINLSSHVTGQLTNTNLADDAVTKRNIASFTDPNLAIPAYEIIDGTTYYFIDPDTFQDLAAFDTDFNVTSNAPGDLAVDDFVFGSDSLDDDTDTDHDTRVIFDKSKGFFAAGTVTGSEWNNANRGVNSVVFGNNNTGSAITSSVLGGASNSITGTGDNNAIVSGEFNAISGTSSWSTIAGGGGHVLSADDGNSISSSSLSFIAGGANNSVSGGVANFLGGGANNAISGDCNLSAIAAGFYNVIDSASGGSFIGGGGDGPGAGNTISDSKAFIGAGDTNIINESAGSSAICAGSVNTIGNDVVDSSNSFIGAGNGLTIIGSLSAILAGEENIITSSGSSVILGGGGSGLGNEVQSNKALIGVGQQHIVKTFADHSGILVGTQNTIGDDVNSSEKSVILSGTGNTLIGDNSLIAGGSSNTISNIQGTATIVGGSSNTVDNFAIGAFIGAGGSNTIGDGATTVDYTAIVAGDSNTADGGSWNFIGAGRYNNISSGSRNVIVGGGGDGAVSGNQINIHSFSGIPGQAFLGSGTGNELQGSQAGLVSGTSNTAYSNNSFIGAGSSNVTGDSTTTAGANAAVVAGNINTALSSQSFIGAGDSNKVGLQSNNSAILAGTGNDIDLSTTFSSSSSAIIAGDNNQVDSDRSIVGAGLSNVILPPSTGQSRNSGIFTGEDNLIESTSHWNAIVGGGMDGYGNTITGIAARTLIGAGQSNIIDGVSDAFIGAGDMNSISSNGNLGFIGAGANNIITAANGFIGAGDNNTVSGAYGSAIGRYAAAENEGVLAHASGSFAADGDAQYERVIYRYQTSTVDRKIMGLDGTETGRYLLELNSSYAFFMRIIARRTDVDGETNHYTIEGTCHIDGTVGSMLIDQSTKTPVHQDTVAWDVDVFADISSGALEFGVTGENAKTINWVGVCELVKTSG